jgi:hypothetical protein
MPSGVSSGRSASEPFVFGVNLSFKKEFGIDLLNLITTFSNDFIADFPDYVHFGEMRLKVGQITGEIDGKKTQFDTAPVVKDGLLYLPLRKITEALGAKVGWDFEFNTRAHKVTITQ